MHPLLVTDDIHAEFERMKALGVKFKAEKPVAIEAGVNKGGFAIYLFDPDGITLELLPPPSKELSKPAPLSASWAELPSMLERLDRMPAGCSATASASCRAPPGLEARSVNPLRMAGTEASTGGAGWVLASTGGAAGTAADGKVCC